MPKPKNKVHLPESKLLKAMADLESSIEKGDVLEGQDPEGGLATEGAPLSNAAPSGKADRAKKSRAASDDASSVSKGDSESSMAKMLSASDDASEEPPKKKSKKKFEKAESMSSDDASSDDGSSEDEPAEKSFRDQAEDDETMSKAILVNDFLESLVENISVAFTRLGKSLEKSFIREVQASEARINARIDHRVAKSVSIAHEFHGRLAKAVTAIGETVQGDVVDMIKSLTNSPAPSPRGKAMLSKGEVNQPPWTGNQSADRILADGSSDYAAELREVPNEVIGDWLFKKSALNQVDPKLIMAWEADRYNVEVLPESVQKSLVNDLCKT